MTARRRVKKVQVRQVRQARRPMVGTAESKLINSRGGSRRWSKIAKDVARKQPICWLQLPGYCRGRSETADHFWPRSTHPHLAETASNLRGACIPCNRRRRDIHPHRIEELRRQCAAETRQKPVTRLGGPPRALRIFGD